MNRKQGENRDQRWAFRVGEDALVRAASTAEETSLSSFVRDAAVSEARRVLADRTHFELQLPEWEQFMELLNRPARAPLGLEKLFGKPSISDTESLRDPPLMR